MLISCPRKPEEKKWGMRIRGREPKNGACTLDILNIVKLFKRDSLIWLSNFNTKYYTRFFKIFHIKIITQHRFHVISDINVWSKQALPPASLYIATPILEPISHYISSAISRQLRKKQLCAAAPIHLLPYSTSLCQSPSKLINLNKASL